MTLILIWGLPMPYDAAYANTGSVHVAGGLVSSQRLSQLRPGRTGYIVGLEAAPELEPRLFAMGFHPGQELHVLRQAPFNGPLHVRIGTTDVLIRPSEAHSVVITAR